MYISKLSILRPKMQCTVAQATLSKCPAYDETAASRQVWCKYSFKDYKYDLAFYVLGIN